MLNLPALIFQLKYFFRNKISSLHIPIQSIVLCVKFSMHHGSWLLELPTWNFKTGIFLVHSSKLPVSWLLPGPTTKTEFILSRSLGSSSSSSSVFLSSLPVSFLLSFAYFQINVKWSSASFFIFISLSLSLVSFWLSSSFQVRNFFLNCSYCCCFARNQQQHTRKKCSMKRESERGNGV